MTGWAGARAAEARDHRLSPEERPLAPAKDVLVGVVAVTGVATAVEGVRFARSAPNGAVPLRDGDHAAVNATPESALRKRRVNALGRGLAARSPSWASTRRSTRRASAARRAPRFRR